AVLQLCGVAVRVGEGRVDDAEVHVRVRLCRIVQGALQEEAHTQRDVAALRDHAVDVGGEVGVALRFPARLLDAQVLDRLLESACGGLVEGLVLPAAGVGDDAGLVVLTAGLAAAGPRVLRCLTARAKCEDARCHQRSRRCEILPLHFPTHFPGVLRRTAGAADSFTFRARTRARARVHTTAGASVMSWTIFTGSSRFHRSNSPGTPIETQSLCSTLAPMLPEHLASHLTSAQAHTDSEGPRPTIAQLIHASQVQMMAARTAAAQFAHTNGLNLIDFNVVQSVVSLGDEDETATPGYIARQLSLSASTLTSILERLVRSGYLVRERDSADRRRISIYHTDKSAQLIADFYVHLSGQVEAQ